MNNYHGPITPKEKFALVWLLACGIILTVLLLVLLYIFSTTYEFGEFSLNLPFA